MIIQTLRFLILVAGLLGFLSLPLVFARVPPAGESSKESVLEQTAKKTSDKTNGKPMSQIDLKAQPYSFRPLLIQGKKEVGRQITEMKLETGALVESEVFFIDQDFKKRIFTDEGFSE